MFLKLKDLTSAASFQVFSVMTILMPSFLLSIYVKKIHLCKYFAGNRCQQRWLGFPERF